MVLVTWLVAAVDRIVVPLVLLGQIVRSGLITRALPRPLPRGSGRAGFWSGVALTVLMIPVIAPIPADLWGSRPNAAWITAAVLVPPTVWLLRVQSVLDAGSTARTVGFVTLTATAVSGTALVLTLLVEPLRAPVRTTTLAALVVLLAVLALRPNRAREDDRPPVLYE